MVRLTPALDGLTERSRADFLRDITQLDAPWGSDLPGRMTMRAMLASKTAPSPGAISYLQLGSLVQIAIPRLYNLEREPVPRDPDGRRLERVVREPALEGVGHDITTNLRALVRDTDDYLIGMISDTAADLPDPEVSALLLELWHTREEEFDPDAPGNELDFNADDTVSLSFEDPHKHLLDLIVDTTTARLMKRHGPELVLAWADAVTAARQ
jgi:hypothetical protein